ncbi:MAG: hypothetical protein ACFFDN_40655, partial [Candidatus Hodarchaeota archaeon]
WTLNIFRPELYKKLKLEMGNVDIKIFPEPETIDRLKDPDIQTNALLHSCVFLPVWSRCYFTSPRCLAELLSFGERQEMLDSRLIVPVSISHKKHFIPLIPLVEKNAKCFGNYFLTNATFKNRKSERYNEFELLVKGLAERIEGVISKLAPKCNISWPITSPFEMKEIADEYEKRAQIGAYKTSWPNF